MVTSGLDRRLAVYDIRALKPLHKYFLPAGASCLSLSQRGLLSAATGDVVQVHTYTSASGDVVQVHTHSSVSGDVVQIHTLLLRDVVQVHTHTHTSAAGDVVHAHTHCCLWRCSTGTHTHILLLLEI